LEELQVLKKTELTQVAVIVLTGLIEFVYCMRSSP